jgi:type VI protein secretion system component Hcp
MAGRLILMKNSETQIKGDCEAEGYKDYLKLDSLQFGAAAHVQHDAGTGSIHQSSVSISLPFGPWVAELQQRLFHGTGLGEIELIEVQQKVDAANNKSWAKVREFKLVEGWVESISHSWSHIHPSVSLVLQYTDITFSWGDKVAHYNRSEKS